MADNGVTNWPATDNLNLPTDKTIAPTSAGDGNYVFIELLRRLVGVARALWTDLTQGMTHDLPMGSHKVTGLGTPTASTDAATKAYVDATAQGLSPKQSVKGASTTNHSVGAFSGSTIDGGSVSLSTGDRILLKDQSTASQNGIWVFNGAGSALTRPTDFATGAQEAGAFVFVESGTTNAGRGYVLASTAVTVDTTAQTWTQFSGAGEITAGTGLTKSGDTINVVANADGTIVANADDVQVGALVAANIPTGLITSAMLLDGAIVNADVNAAAAIARSKLDFGSGLVNADIAAAAAIAYSKLALTGSVVNADIAAAAAIAYSKLALTGAIVNGDINAAAAIAYSKLALTNSIVDADIAAGAAIALSKVSGAAHQTDYQVFNAGTANWTKPSWATATSVVEVHVIGAGGGGGSGRRGAAGSVRCGGGAGSGGAYNFGIFKAGDLGSPVNVTVGAGGTAGAAQTVDSTDGNNGGDGGATYFGPSATTAFVRANTGLHGSGGTATTGSGGNAQSGMFSSTAGAAASTTGLVGNGGTQAPAAPGGGAGGGITSGDAVSNGGTGTYSWQRTSTTVPAGGSAPGGNGTSGASDATSSAVPGTSGAGGASSITGAAGTGGDGAAGSGGGGGGASLNGNNSGAGGKGGDGLIIVITRG